MSENKIQAIYDALDGGSNKNALKLCDAVLKKSKGPNAALIMVP